MSGDAIAAVLEALEAADSGLEPAALPKRFCFVEGTHIATLRGEMPVHAIHVFDDLDAEAQAKIALGRVLRGAVEEGLPKRDLYVSDGQEFELSRRLEIAHAVRMTVRKSGEALSGLRFVVFACNGLPMIRAEGIWTTLTPIERAFPAAAPQAEPADDGAPEAAAEAPAEPAPRPVSRLMEAAARTGGPTRRPLTRMLSRPVSAPASHRTETGTPGP